MAHAVGRALELDGHKACPTEPEPADQVDRVLLTLLAAGVTDQAIARHLGLGLRTVQRRVGSLMRQLGAQTRFQAGLQAARKGLL